LLNMYKRPWKPRYIEAVYELLDDKVAGGPPDGPISAITLHDGQIAPSEEAIQTKLASMIVEWDAQEYARNRAVEYPSIQDLVVALYDTDDKSAIEAKRAEIKAKYPKE